MIQMSQETEFKNACYDQNSIEELIEALQAKKADKADMKEWGLTATQWRNAIKTALKEKIDDMV